MIVLALLACASVLGGAAAQENIKVPVLGKYIAVWKIPQPWDVEVSDDGDIFYTEKCNGLSVLRAGEKRALRLFGSRSSGSAYAADDFFCEGQSGANGIALDPNFSRNRLIYLFMPSTRGSRPSNRVVKLWVSPDLSRVTLRTDIITDIPYKREATPNGREGSHSGGRLRFGPDGYLYVTTGDNHNGSLPQDKHSLGGKVLRVDRNGRAAPGNRMPPWADQRIFTYGHRNVQGIAFQPWARNVVIAEHGPSYDDEVTVLRVGGNGGWDPQNRPGLDCPDSYCGYAGTRETMPMTDTDRFSDAMEPAYTFNNQGGRGTGPCEFLRGARWGPWRNRLVIGVMAAEELVLLTMSRSGAVSRDVVISGLPSFPPSRFRSLKMGPDNALYVVIDGDGENNGQIWQINAFAGSSHDVRVSDGAVV